VVHRVRRIVSALEAVGPKFESASRRAYTDPSVN
jgi:hypothetical protein